MNVAKITKPVDGSQGKATGEGALNVEANTGGGG